MVKVTRCGWCEIFLKSATGLCICDEACGIITCPARNADNYTVPAVPRFKE